MLNRLKTVLERLQGRFNRKAEEAYDERDAATDPGKESYAAGEAHAFGVAADDVRAAEKENE
jgi:hypothetical protein